MDETYAQDGQNPEGVPTPPVPDAFPDSRLAGDGYPGGDEPASSGFSWRLPGTSPAVMHSQGGIPNEFDHLFRDSNEDGRRSLMPSQGPIGVSVPPVGPARPSVSPPNGNENPNGEPPLPTYQPAVQQQSGSYPQQPTYQQPVYQSPTQVPVGPPGSDDDERNTQSIPRVPVQPYAYVPIGEPAQSGPSAYGTAGGPPNSKTPLIVAVGVFVVLIVLATVMFTGNKDKPATGSTPKAGGTESAAAASATPGKGQADAIRDLMAQGTPARNAANSAITDVNACKNVDAAQATFASAAATRQDQADKVSKLPIDQLPPAAKQLVQDLQSAWQYSADSENKLADWATDNLTCTGKPTNNSNYTKSQSDGNKAGSLKATIAKEWNSMAASIGEDPIEDKIL